VPVPRHAPRLDEGGLVLASGLEPDDDDELVDVALDGVDASGRALDAITVTRCRFVGVRLAGASLTRARFGDAELVRCDLAGADLSEARLERVRFVDCRATGAELPQSVWKSVEVRDTALDDVNLRHARLESVAFACCRLATADLGGATLRDVRLRGSDLTAADVKDVSCERVDLRGAVLTDLRHAAALAGATVSPDQLVQLAPALARAVGLRVEHDDT
jgi:uncharacterized protein YjbI with pentapeptide repeats